LVSFAIVLLSPFLFLFGNSVRRHFDVVRSPLPAITLVAGLLDDLLRLAWQNSQPSSPLSPRQLLGHHCSMANFRRQILNKTFMLLDLGILAVSFMVAAVRIWHLTAFSSFASFISMRVKVLNILLFLGLIHSWHVIFCRFGLYRSRRLGDRKLEAVDVLKAVSAGALVLGLVSAIFRLYMITPAFIVVFWAVASSLILLYRWLLRMFLGWVRMHGRNSRQMLIVGTNPRAIEFARTIVSKPELGYHLIGFVDEQWSGAQEFGKNGKAIVSDLEHFSGFLRERIVDEVTIALPMKSFYSQAANIVATCQEQGVIVRVLTSIFDVQPARANAELLDELPVTTFGSSVFEGWPLVFKRLLDIIVSSILLILLAPIFLIVAILIKFDSPGPVFFVQERVGLNKRKFQMYKFRTMVADAERRQAQFESLNEADGPIFKIKDDPRLTRLGKFLRKASIDELPQLLNVLKNDMSLVGPRPLDLRDYKGLEEDWLRRRFSVPPGITCLWQINGRSSVSFKEWMRLDMRYIDHWSMRLDLEILAKTIPAVLRGSGAV
jgi:exopolysaccharide biosynthesis polyprenyl glycosylphosphotransferase